MTDVVVIGDSHIDHAVVLAAFAHMPLVKWHIAAMKEAEARAIRTVLLTGSGHGMEVGQAVHFGGKTYRVAAQGPTMREVMLEQMVRQPLSFEPPSKPAYGSDRPYLKKKKGRS